MVRPELLPLLGENWRRSLRQLDPEALVRGAILLGRRSRPPDASKLDATAWSEARRQRLEALLRALPRSGAGGAAVTSVEGRDLHLTPRDCTGLLWAAAQCRATPSAALRESASDVIEAVSSSLPTARGGLQTSDVARCFWAAATLRWSPDDRLLRSAAVAARPVLEGASPQDLSNLVWASSTIRFDPDGWIGEVAGHFARSERVQGPQAVSNVLWALAKGRAGAPSDMESNDESSVPQATSPADAASLGNTKLLLRALAPCVLAILPVAESQHVANIMWAYGRLSVRDESSVIQAAGLQMCNLLGEASPQHIANAVWASARLSVEDRHLFCSVSDHLHERVLVDSATWQRRWSQCSLRHISVLCWAFARTLPTHFATRRCLRDAASRVEELASVSVVQSQERANILWAYAEAAESWADIGGSRPAAVLNRVVRSLCDSHPTSSVVAATVEEGDLEKVEGGDDSAAEAIHANGSSRTLVATIAVAHALSKLYAGLNDAAKLSAQRWLCKAIDDACMRGLEGLRPSETATFLRSLSFCHVLRVRPLRLCLADLLRSDEGILRVTQLQPQELAATLEAIVALQGRVPSPETGDIAVAGAKNFPMFKAREIIAIVSALVRLSPRLPQGELEPTLALATAALARRQFVLPEGWVGGLQSSPSDESCTGQSPMQTSRRPIRLSAQEWTWALSGASPLELILVDGSLDRGPCVRASAPYLVLERLIRPWCSGLSVFIQDIIREAASLSALDVSIGARASDIYRYTAVVHRGPSSLGPRWTPVALRMLGVHTVSQPTDLLRDSPNEDITNTHDTAAVKGIGYARVGAILQHSDALETTVRLDFSARGNQEVDSQHAEASALVAVCGPSQRDNAAVHPELQVLQSLLAKAGNGPWHGKVFLYSERTPCLSCLGAIAQLSCRWPNVRLSVAIGQRDSCSASGSSEVVVEDEVLLLSNLRPFPSSAEASKPTTAQLEEAMKRFVEAQPALGASTVPAGATPLGSIGADSRVQRLWADVSGTSLRSKPLEKAGKKREWQDKLKYFVHHRPEAFTLTEDSKGVAMVRLRTSPSERSEVFKSLVDIVERAVSELLSVGKGMPDDSGREGFVPIEELGSRADVSAAWRSCRYDVSDRLSYFLKHSDSFQVWIPPSESGDLRTRVRTTPTFTS